MPASGLTLAQVLADPIKKDELVQQATTRMRLSSDYYQAKLDTAIRCWKIYRAIVDSKDDTDEPNTGPCYAFGIIEDAVAGVSESILNSRVPTPAKPRKAGDEKKAENFNTIAAAYFSTGQYQEDYPDSVRERIITGWNWEVDCWAWRYRKGRRWGYVEAKGEDAQPYKKMSEVATDDPVQVGYFTRFPSIFNVFPQPGIIKVEKMKWLEEIEERVSLEDLREHRYIDPATKQMVNFFDLSEIEAAREQGKKIRPADPLGRQTDHQEELRQITEGASKASSQQEDDIDQLNLLWVVEPDLLYCVAYSSAGANLIAYVENLHHTPGIKYRIKRCTPQKGSLTGLGMVEPVESLFGELDDIHKLSMRNWVRIINRMIAYNPDTVVDAEKDFKPSAMGRIRVRPQLGGSIAGEIMSVDIPDVTKSMLTQESNVKGLLERALGLPDFSRGIEGTKQGHDTLGGLQMIQGVVAKRVASIRRQELAGFQKQMFNMERMYSQFLVEKMPFSSYGPDGSTVLAEFDLWDIATEGRGFEYTIEYDPSAGDDAIARVLMMALLDQGIKYNQSVITQFPPGTKPLAQLDEIMRRCFRVSGFSDTSKVLSRPDGVLPPEAEIVMMLQGKPVMPNPSENLVEHYAAHVAQMNDPQLREAVQRGAAPPDVMVRLSTHIEVTARAIQAALADPSMLIRAKQFQGQQSAGAPGASRPGMVPPAPVGGEA